MDVAFAIGILVFLALTVALAIGCRKLGGPQQ
jgi:hypothetical protein